MSVFDFIHLLHRARGDESQTNRMCMQVSVSMSVLSVFPQLPSLIDSPVPLLLWFCELLLELSSLHVPQAVSRRKAPSARGVPQATGFPWRHTRIDITTILHNAPQLHYSLHLTHTVRSSPSRGPSARRPLPKSSRTVLVLRYSKGICKKSLLTKIPFQRIPKPRPIANYYSTPSRDEW